MANVQDPMNGINGQNTSTNNVNNSTSSNNTDIEYLKSIDATLSRQMGMITLDDCLYDLYKEGAISRENALIYAQDQAALKKKM